MHRALDEGAAKVFSGLKRLLKLHERDLLSDETDSSRDVLAIPLKQHLGAFCKLKLLPGSLSANAENGMAARVRSL